MDTTRDEGAGFVLVQCELFEQLVAATKERPVRPGLVVAKIRKMYVELLGYRAAVGRTGADDSLDAVLSFARTCAWDLLQG